MHASTTDWLAPLDIREATWTTRVVTFVWRRNFLGCSRTDVLTWLRVWRVQHDQESINTVVVQSSKSKLLLRARVWILCGPQASSSYKELVYLYVHNTGMLHGSRELRRFSPFLELHTHVFVFSGKTLSHLQLYLIVWQQQQHEIIAIISSFYWRVRRMSRKEFTLDEKTMPTIWLRGSVMKCRSTHNHACFSIELASQLTLWSVTTASLIAETWL